MIGMQRSKGLVAISVRQAGWPGIGAHAVTWQRPRPGWDVTFEPAWPFLRAELRQDLCTKRDLSYPPTD